MAYAAFRKIALPPSVEPPSQPKSLPAPTGGWVSAKNPSSPAPLKTYGPTAERLECFFPTQTGIEVMGGSAKVATLGTTSQPVESGWSYLGGTARKHFAACAGSIFNITSLGSTTTIPAADVTGQTSNYYSTQNFATSGGNFLYALSGTDKPQLYNGTTWTAIDAVSTPSITGVTTSSLSQVNVYRNRLFMVQGGTMNVWALPVASLGGAAIQISLSGIFQLGGSVLFTATWSLDSGSGLDDNLVIVSTEGEIAIYNGSDPSDPNNWSLVGVYSGPRPLGKNGFTKEGSTLEILTEKGLIPITAMINRSKDEISPYAHSRAIEPDWVKEAAARASVPWEIVKWPIKQRTVINVPAVGTVAAKPFMVNTTTGAWCSRPGWDTRCIWLYQNFVYFGTTTGTVMQMEITGSDNGSPYYPVMVLAWDNYGTPGFQKTVMSMRAIFTVTSPVVPLLSISSDYVISLPNPPTIPANTTPSSLWDVGLWDSALWDNAAVPVNYDTGWETIGQSGYAVAAQLQLSIGNTAAPDIELITMQALFETGEIMVPT